MYETKTKIKILERSEGRDFSVLVPCLEDSELEERRANIILDYSISYFLAHGFEGFSSDHREVETEEGLCTEYEFRFKFPDPELKELLKACFIQAMRTIGG